MYLALTAGHRYACTAEAMLALMDCTGAASIQVAGEIA